MKLTRVPTCLLLAFALASLAGAEAGASRSWFSPTRAVASPGAGMALIPGFRVLNNAYTCADSFANVQASLSGNRLTLAYRAVRPGSGPVVCPGILADYGPAFRLPALGPGYYEVHEQVWTCPPDAPLCEMPAPVHLGLLAVSDGHGGWDMRPDSVDPARPFSLQLLDPAYGNCFVGFPDTAVTVSGPGLLTLSFSVEYFSARLCLVDIRPHGPAYAMPGLPSGRYPVQIVERPACMRDSTPCSPQVLTPLLLDTLTVRQSAGLRPGAATRPDLPGPHPPDLLRGFRIDGRKAGTRPSPPLR